MPHMAGGRGVDTVCSNNRLHTEAGSSGLFFLHQYFPHCNKEVFSILPVLQVQWGECHAFMDDSDFYPCSFYPVITPPEYRGDVENHL